MNDYLIIITCTLVLAASTVLAWMQGYNNGKADERRRANTRINAILDRQHAMRMKGGLK